jgi:ABC-type branched-subunit amino acid transport system substrate-binding protein
VNRGKHGFFGVSGPPTFAATHVVDEAIAAVGKSGQTPSRANVLAAIKKTNEPATILGQPIRFDSHGDSAHRKFFPYKINSSGKYRPTPG